MLVATLMYVAANKATISSFERWNRVLLHLSTALVLGSLIASHRAVRRASVAGLLAVLLVRAPTTVLRRADPEHSYGPYRHRAATWLETHTSEQDRIGSWNAGTLGYFSHRCVVSLDGLVNDRVYFETVIRGKRLEEYLIDNKIERLADQACGPAPRPTIYLARTGSASLERAFVLEAVFHRDEAPDGCPGYAVWRRRPEAAGN